MKTSRNFCRLLGRFFPAGFLPGLILALFAAVGAPAQTVPLAGAFVEPLPQFIAVDTRVDASIGTPTSGTTYVLGRDDSNNAILRKYDASGAELAFDNGTNQVYISGITPTALAVVSGTTNLYIVGGGKVYRVSTATGQANATLAGPSSLSLQSVYYFGGVVYVAGNFNSTANATIFGRTAYARGSQAGIIIKLTSGLSATATGLLTFGDSGAGSINTANSLVVDDSGDIYVGGHLGTGSFASDVFNSGNFNVTYRHRTSGIGSLTDAATVLASALSSDITETPVASRPNMCGIGTSDDNGDHNYIWRETGIINVPTAGQVTFTSTTDDGSWVYVDGVQVVYDNTAHGSEAHAGTIGLFAGLHSIDWLYWNGGGPGNGSLTASGGGLSGCVTAADFTSHQNKGYVLKFAGDLSFLKNAYFTTATSGIGGDISELTYAQGWVYATGFWQGNANNAAINPVDASNAGSKDVDILKLDTGLQLRARATVKGAADNTGFSITADEAGNAYITGTYGQQSASFFGNGDSTNQPFASISASKTSIFIAQLDSNFTFQWVNTPSGTPPDFSFPSKPRVRWNTVLQRVFWTGYFNAGSLLMGNPNAVQTLNGPEGFLAVLDPDGKYTERVNLTVVSDYGVGGTQVKPFGGPALNTNSVANAGNTKPVIKGAQVTVAVPSFLYRDITNRDITIETQADASKIDSLAETRIGCTGYSVDENVANGIASSYTFTLTKDTIVKFNWLVEHALRIKADFSQTAGSDNAATAGHIVGLQSQAAGSPLPAVQKHWIAENEPVIATIDAAVDDQAYLARGLPVRYVVTGFDAYGPANTLGAAGTTNFIAFLGSDQRRQVPQFLMTGPASINYRWKLKIGVQVATTGLKSSGFPLVLVTSDPGGVTPTQPNGNGIGTYYFDENTSLQIGALRSQDTTQLKGWYNGDGTVFANTGSLSNLAGSFTRTNSGVVQTYAAQTVPLLQRPARVLWDYGDRIFEETVFIGNIVTFATVDDPAVSSKLRKDLEPEHVEVIESPLGSAGSDMAMWDSVGKKYYPLRPGTLMSYWYTSADPNDRVIIRLTFKYPVVPHYRHIANTRPVPLDPATNDLVTFSSLKYTEATTGAAVDSSGNFTATGPGKTVLMFNETSSVGRGGSIVTPRIRVVETRSWNDQLPATQTAIIGKKITSAYDTAGLGTGYLFFNQARYNTSTYNRDNLTGQIIPVNLNPTAGPDEQFVVVWYENRDKILWPYQAVRYQPAWPTTAEGLGRIVISSRYGNESVAADGTDQIVVPAETVGTNSFPAETALNPARFQQVRIYNQPDRTLPGYNPNEEHALLAPSLRSAAISPQPLAAYALRDGDLNVTTKDSTYTSDPYVLVQFLDSADGEYKMKVYSIVRTASNFNVGDLSYNYAFEQEMFAGEPVIPFYPLPQVIGATPCPGSYGKDGQPSTQICYWKDHKGTAWAVSGNSFFYGYYFYPLLADFWWPASGNKQPGDCVAFLPGTPGFAGAFFAGIDYTRNDQTPAAQGIYYTTIWPQDVPILKVGETLTFPGGEYRLDHPTTTVITDTGDFATEQTPGLPGVLGFAAGQVVFDTMNPVMNDQVNFDSYTARIFPALEERTVSLSVNNLPAALNPANGRTTVRNGLYYFNQLPSSLQKRVFYDPIRAKLGIKGFLNDKDISDSTLTASPPAVYVLEPSVITLAEKQILDGTAATSPFQDLAGTPFATAMDLLFDLTRNPNQLDKGGDGVDTAYRIGLEPKVKVDPATGQPLTSTAGGIITVQRDATKAATMQALGPGLAMVANPNFLDPNNPVQISYVTLAENNSDALGGAPVVLHIIKVDKTQRYRGSIKTILSDNVFDENIILRHTGDFGGNADDLVFEWWYRPEDGTEALPPDRAPSPTPWKLFADPSGNLGKGFYQLTLKGNPSAPEVLLGDTLFYLRYRHKNEVTSGVNWEVPQPNGERRCVLDNCQPGIPYDWAGAGNSSPEDIDADGQPDYKPQLAEGWIKRVLSAVNPYEARIRDFTGNSPATYSSIIQELGAPYSGPVALNPDKNVIENVGLIALYQTILNRGMDLSINLSTPITGPTIANALQLASTRISDFYLLLGNEAHSDSLNPTIGFGSDSVEYGNMAPAVLAFQNQLSSRLDEELGLLRGLNFNAGTPVFNRLYWNFSHAEGEAAYAMKYNINDINQDGFIDATDAMTLYPQGHGDAWGHYLTAAKMQYDLLRHPYFNWVSRSEFINSQDVVIPVDYLDERKFAQIAAAKAEAGAEIVNMTYRQKFVADPRGQWQGYLDTDPNLAWGVDEWARRAGQGAFFDWVTANALLPAVHPNTNYTGIQKIDRTTVADIASVVGNLSAIQQTMDQVDGGNNPLGLANGALSFTIEPNFLIAGSGTQNQKFFDQIYAKALVALNNAKATFDNANQFNNMIRQVANSETEFRNKVYEEDLGYRNQLIEIFGTPYEGTIGSGKLYPAGYQGPDIALYAYVKVNNVNDSTVPKPSQAFVSNLADQTTGDSARLFKQSGIVIPLPSDWKTKFNLALFNGTAASVNYSDFSPGTTPNVSVQNLNLPVMANGYSYVAPESWGNRSSTGQLQSKINEMVQAQADLNRQLYAWDAAQEKVIGKLRYLNAKMDWDANITALKLSKAIADVIFDQTANLLKTAAAFSSLTGDTVFDLANATKEMIPTMTPEVGLSISPGDALAPARGGIEVGGWAAKLGSKFTATSLDTAGDVVRVIKALADAGFDAGVASYETKEAWLAELTELNTYAADESDQRVAVFKQVEVLNQLSDDYRTVLANGVRLMELRTAFNKRTAAQTQQNRYQDMTFRFSRNAALEKYRSSFDLAARYAYLAASAYDYDLNLSLDDAGSPAEIMSDIVRQRSVGLVADGVPQIGAKGLAEDLAKLKANYGTLSSQMGLDNPQIETSTFSLRAERFRLFGANATNTDDSVWQQTMQNPQYYKADLWQVPEFRRYCRPFAAESAGPQPGLVIPLSTKIVSGLNFFGWPLGGGDSAYDPSVYATRVLSVGVAFAGYDTVNLTRTPHVYLIPAGTDIMTVPNSPDFDLRLWNVKDQVIPIPYPATTANLGSPTWKPFLDTVNSPDGSLGDIRKFSSFRATGFDSVDPADIDISTLTYDSRLVGRSAWNTKWLLIIPGATLNADPATGLNGFINSVKDIQLIINTYGFSGN